MLNEPEASLHPDLIAPLARLIGAAAERAQVVVVSHAPALVEALDALPGARRFTLDKRLGETVVEGEGGDGVDMAGAMKQELVAKGSDLIKTRSMPLLKVSISEVTKDDLLRVDHYRTNHRRCYPYWHLYITTRFPTRLFTFRRIMGTEISINDQQNSSSSLWQHAVIVISALTRQPGKRRVGHRIVE